MVKSRKGFTLVELLAIIIILAIIVGISVTVATSIMNSAKKKSYRVTLNEVATHAYEYIVENNVNADFESIDGTNLEFQCVTVQDLIDYGYLDSSVTGSNISDSEVVKASNHIYLERDKTTKAITKQEYLYGNSERSYLIRCKDVIVRTFKVTYSANGGTGTMADTICYENEDCILRENAFENLGYSFDSWNSAPDGGTKYGNVIKLTSDIMVYAGWKANTYKVGLDNNEATVLGTSEIFELYNTNYSLDADNKKKMLANKNAITLPKRTGYTFDGYYTKENGQGKKYINDSGYITSDADNKFCVGGNCDLYAKWNPKTYKVTLDDDGATQVGTKEIYEIYNNNYSLDKNNTKKMTVTKNAIVLPKKTGYTFEGYYTKKNGQGVKYVAENGFITHDADTKYCTNDNCKLYANWVKEEKKKVTVTYKAYTLCADDAAKAACDKVITDTCNGGTKQVTVGEPYGDLCRPIEKVYPPGVYFGDKVDNPFQLYFYHFWYLNLSPTPFDAWSSTPQISSSTIVTETTDHNLYLICACYGGDSANTVPPSPYYIGGGQWYVPATGNVVNGVNEPNWDGSYSTP